MALTNLSKATLVVKVGRCVGRQGDWSVGVLAIMAMGEVDIGGY